MADNLELDFVTLSKTLKKQASGIRQIAGETLDGDFRRGLLELAQDYDHQAEKLVNGYAPHRMSATKRRPPQVADVTCRPFKLTV
jgi:hypothetical protein